MQPSSLKPSVIARAVLLPALMILLGVGCREAGEQLANEALNPVTTAVNAVGKATITVAEEQAKKHAAEDAVSDDVTIALILPKDAPVPEDAEVAKETAACDQRIVYTKIARKATTDDVVHDALVTLFDVKGSVTGLTDALKKAKLSVDKIALKDGVTEVWLKGDLTAADSCALAAAKAQITTTVARFKTAFKIYLNGSAETYANL